MRFMRGVLWVLLCSAILGVICSFVLEASYNAKAQMVQVVRINHNAHNPFGPETLDQGQPAMLILEDQHAFLKNKTPLGYPMVDEEYVRQHGDAVLQLKTVESVTGMARAGCLLSGIIAILGLAVLKRVHAFLVPPPPDLQK